MVKQMEELCNMLQRCFKVMLLSEDCCLHNLEIDVEVDVEVFLSS